MSALSYFDTILRAEPSAMLTKVTVILIVSSLSALATRRASAAVRHVVWLAGLISAASMVVLAPMAPSISVPVPSDARQIPVTAAPPSDRLLVLENQSPAVARAQRRSVVSTERVATPRSDLRSSAVAICRDLASRLSTALTESGLFALWAVGAAFILARALFGHATVARLIRHARPLSDDDLAVFSDRLGARRVRMLVSDRIATPFTSRWRRPVIVLPANAARWSEERRRMVLLHELAHIVRGDYAAQGVATVAAAMLWFHPLAWVALARLKAEAEHAADDVVLSNGMSGVVYASHLLELARGATPMRLSAAVSVGVVRSSRVERRFIAILDERRARRGLGWKGIGVAALAAAVALSPLAGVRTVARAMTPRAQSAPPVSPPAPPNSAGRTTPIRVLELPQSGDSRRNVPDSVIERSIPAVSAARLNLELPTGGGIAVHGWDSTRIRVRAELGGDDWRDVRLDLTRNGQDATLSSRFSSGGTHSTSLSFDIWVPQQTDLELSSAGGSIEIDHVAGALRGHTGGGSIAIRNGRGRADLSTGGGGITVTDSRLDGTLRSGWGRVRIENNTGDLQAFSNGSSSGLSADRGLPPTVPPPSWPLTTSQGDEVSVVNTNVGCMSVSVGKPSENTRFSLSKDGGSIYLPLAQAGVAISTGGGRIVIDSTAGGVVAATGGGDVELRAASGNTTVSTGAGNVSIRVVGASSVAHNVNVCDGSGRVVLDLPSDLDATIELETAYTNTAARPTTIQSDFDLTHSETREWDDRFGTPRKFVRAIGKVGAGMSVIRVSTVNGEIVVRRR